MTAAYSVNGVEVIDSLGRLDWSNVRSAPTISGPQGVAVAAANCATYGNVSASVNAATGAVTITIGLSGGASLACACVCDCGACDCACGG